MHETTSLDFARRIIWELFRNCNIAIEILDKNLKITVKLEEWKPSLFDLSVVCLLQNGLYYHRHISSVGSFLSNLEIQQRPKLLSMLEIQLVKSTNPSQENAILEFPHIGAGLEHHCWICGNIFLPR
jgi:hypothetical protein